MTDDTTGWAARLDAITLFADDLAACRAFYAAAFGAAPVFEDADSTVFRIGGVLVNLLRAEAVPELIEPAAMAPADAGARAVYTVGVDDVDGRCAALAASGVALLNGPVDRPWGTRTASFRDPAGHIWEIAGPPA